MADLDAGDAEGVEDVEPPDVRLQLRQVLLLHDKPFERLKVCHRGTIRRGHGLIVPAASDVPRRVSRSRLQRRMPELSNVDHFRRPRHV